MEIIVDLELEELTGRKKTLLYNAINNYIKVASPITSLLVQQTELYDLSTATIRNELSALEAMGYLRQLHTSSGRVPTTKGYRFFVNETMKNVKFRPKDLKGIRKKMFARTTNLDEIVESISQIVLSKTNYPTVFMFDGFENLMVESIKILYLLNSEVLVLIETNAGAISSTIQVTSEITKKDCDNATQVFSSIFSGKTIKFLMQNVNNFSTAIKKSMKEYEKIFKLVLDVLKVYYNNARSKISGKGVINLLDSPELKSVESVKKILNVLDDNKSLQNVMQMEPCEGISIKIGEENRNEKLSNCAVIRAPLVLDGKKIATLGVIGPKRLDYANVASVLKFVTDELKNIRRV